MAIANFQTGVCTFVNTFCSCCFEKPLQARGLWWDPWVSTISTLCRILQLVTGLCQISLKAATKAGPRA
jgi:hypothetical protein